MYSQINDPYLASDVLTLHESIVPGQPAFANLKAKRVPKWKNSAELQGPGIYGLLCKGKLYYVGIYTGNDKKLFAGNVLDRWDMHLTFHSLRSPKIRFVASSMKKILKLEGAPADAFAELLGGRDLDIDQLNGMNVPFVGKGPCVTYNKALFATQNWDVLAPGNEDRMLSEISFVYARFLPTSAAFLGDATGTDMYEWVKREWLETRETRLVNALKPICNAVTSDYRNDVGVEEFMEALRKEMEAPLASFDHKKVAMKLERRAARTSLRRAA